jgi:alpha-tubulin suppressor-like RCC1 family protein
MICGLGLRGSNAAAWIGGFWLAAAQVLLAQPVITGPPLNQSIFEGSNVTFRVIANGTPPLYYQWAHESGTLPGKTNSILSLTNLHANNAGAYTVTVTDISGTVTSSPAILTLKPAPPRIVVQPAGPRTWPGLAATLNVEAVGSLPLFYQWHFNGREILEATSSILTLPNAQFTDNGTYSVLVSNSVGSKLSSNAVLTVSQVVPWGAGLTSSPVAPNYGQAIIPAGITNASAIAAGGYHSVALHPDGTVGVWGYSGFGLITNVPTTITNAIAIAAGLNHTLALRNNGTVTAWGYGMSSVITVPTAATNVAAVSAGWYHNLALRSNGTVVAWGAGLGSGSDYGQSRVPTNLAGIKAVAAGGYHSLALSSNGNVVAWGGHLAGQTNVPAGLDDVIAVAAGASNSLALKRDGTVVVWGDNTFGQTNVPVDLTNVAAISAGAGFCLALKGDGTLVGWGSTNQGQTKLPSGLANVTSISAGGYHSLALVSIGPITFLQQPQSQTVYQGHPARFAAPFLGESPLLSQWLRNGFPVPNATNADLNIATALPEDTGLYALFVSNSFGAVTSSVATLTVTEPAPLFALQPASSMIFPSSNRTMIVSVTGLPPLSYQWQRNGLPIPGATNTSWTVTNAQLADEGYYSVTASNAYGMASSSNAFLNVVDVSDAVGPSDLVWSNPSTPPWALQTTNTHDGFAAVALRTQSYGIKSLLQAVVSGPGTLSFWWSAPSSFASLTLTIDGSIMASAGYGGDVRWKENLFYLPAGVHVLTWSCVNNWSPSGGGTAYLDDVVFERGPTLPNITAQPTSRTNAAGTTIAFGIGVIATPPATYQWFFNGAKIAGSTQASLTLTNVQTYHAGSYSVLVDNGYGTAVSSNAALTVTPSAPVINSQPVGAAVIAGGQTTFSGAAIGSEPLAYQWYFNELAIPGATNPLLTLDQVQESAEGTYGFTVSNMLGATISSNAYLSVYAPADLGPALNSAGIFWDTTNVPWFPQTNFTHDGVAAAQSGAIAGKQQSTLQTVVEGPATVTYWWKANCDSFWVNLGFVANGSVLTAIGGQVEWQQATNYVGAGSQILQWNLYPIHSAFAGGTGWVDQVAIEAGGTAARIATSPSSSTNNAGDKVTFSLNAIGTPPLRYQWQFNDGDIVGATNTSLVLSNVQVLHSGRYAARVANDFGSALTSVAVLTVKPSPPVITKQPSSQSRVFRSSALLSVTLVGTAPFAYQWLFNGNPISGSTPSALLLTNLQPADAGSYQVVVSNDFGAVTSSPAILDISETVVIEYGLTPAPGGLGNIVALAAGARHTVALKGDGTVLAWGFDSYNTNVPFGLSDVASLAAGNSHTVALRSNGTVTVWGDNTYGQLLLPIGLSNVIAVAAAANHSFALKQDGAVMGWGDNRKRQIDIPAGLSNVQSIGASLYNGFAVTTEGVVVQWGQGPTWQSNGIDTSLEVGKGASNVVFVVAGGSSGWALHQDGTISSWGIYGSRSFRNYGIATLAAVGTDRINDDYLVVLADEGTIYVHPYFPPSPYIPLGLSNAVAIAAAPDHMAILVNDGTPRVVGLPSRRTVQSDSRTVLAPGILGARPLQYQWQFNGMDMPGATSAYLTLTNIPPSAAGNYRCIGSNHLGVVTNQEVALTVIRSNPHLVPETPLSGDGFSLRVDHLSGHGPVLIYVSSNLLDWQPIFTNPPLTGSFQFRDDTATNQPKRFYRAVEY